MRMWVTGEGHQSRAFLGFTLVELLVTLAILALVSTLLPPALDRAIPRYQLRSAANRLAVDLRTARMTSIATGRPISVQIVSEASPSNFDNAKEVHLPSPVKARIQPFFGSDTKLTFFPDGSSSGGIVYLELERRTAEVVLHMVTGTVELHDPA